MAKPINLRGVRTAESKAGNFAGKAKRISFVLSDDMTKEVCDILAKAADNDAAVGIDVHIGKKRNDDGSSFISGFLFANELEARGGRQRGKRSYVPRSKAKAQQEADTAKEVADKALDDDGDIDF